MRRLQVHMDRVYGEPTPGAGVRVLVDRLWPRGLRKDAVDEWVKDVAPSTELRLWYGHKPERFDEFRSRYERELTDPERERGLRRLIELGEQDGRGVITLLTASKTLDISHVEVLRRLLTRA
jgi:uncharacterized protein YeaO (DUF488 family)